MKNSRILIDKPTGWTSFDVVAKIRGKIRADYIARGEKPTKKQLRVGHAGTLDPFATGLLIILISDECKKAGEYLKLDKTYQFTAKLGEVSTTGDPEGEITKTGDHKPSIEEVESALKQFVGEIEQTPPAYSAIKINGKRAYDLARAGKEVKLESRKVTIYSLKMLEYKYPNLKCEAEVSSGTYIRTLAEDVGRSLGIGAYCTQLRRTKIANWSVEDAKHVEHISVS